MDKNRCDVEIKSEEVADAELDGADLDAIIAQVPMAEPPKDATKKKKKKKRSKAKANKKKKKETEKVSSVATTNPFAALSAS